GRPGGADRAALGMNHAGWGAVTMPDHPQRHVALELPWRTVFKVLAAIALVWCWLHLVSLILLSVGAVLLAGGPPPIVRWFESRGMPRWAGSAIVVFGLIAVIAAVVVFATTQLSGQAQVVGSSMLKAERQLLEHVPERFRAQVSPENAGTSVQS